MSELRSCVVEAMIRGYHEYQSIWEAEVGENLMCIQEPGNVRDPRALISMLSQTRVVNNSWTRPKKNVSYMFALSSKMAC